ncbi:unnamed protein product [Amaranthus hypochondriacus]
MLQRFNLYLRPISWFSVVAHNLSCSSSSTSISCSSINHGNSTCDNGSFNANSRIKPKLEEPALIKLKKERDPDKLFKIFKENAHNSLVIENKYAFEDVVSRLAGARRFDYIEHLLEHQKSLPQGKREGFIVRIIMLYGKAGMIKQAIDTLYDMHMFGCRRTIKSFNATLKVLTQSHDLGAIKSFIEKVPLELGIELDVISVNIVISAFCGMGFLDKAYKVMVEMEKAGISPDVVSYTTLISAFYKHDCWEIGNGLWNLMVYKGCYPNVATFNARIQFLVNRGRAWQANDLLRLMEDLGMQPDEVSYNLVIKGFCRAGYFDMARRVFSALHGRGYKANVKIYQTMVHYLCKARDFDCAYSMCKQCIKKNWVLNVDTIYTLLRGLKSIGKVQKANMILSLCQRRNPPFSARQLADFKAIVAKH